eukprot:jgi/Chrzof1/6344/Cz18g05030.t1
MTNATLDAAVADVRFGIATAPWQLMGRMVSPSSIPLSQERLQSLYVTIAARQNGMTLPQFQQQLQELMTLLPGMAPRLLTLKPSLMAALCADTSAVADKLVQLKLMFPAADLTRMLIKRPMLLLDSEFEAVAEARRKLHAMFPEGGVDELVTQQPLLLVQDVEDIIGELERLVMRIRAYMEWQSIMVSTNVLTTFSR